MVNEIKRARQEVTKNLFDFVCGQISLWVPSGRWYRTSLWFARLLNQTANILAPEQLNVSRESSVPRLLHRFLDNLSTRGQVFPIPLVIEGEDILRQYMDEPGGFVIATAHIPFMKMQLPVVRRVAGGKRKLCVVSRYPEGEDKNLLFTWNDEPWHSLKADETLLLHARTLLRQNGILSLTVDRDQGDLISANIFHFVGKMRSRVIASFTELQEDGSILLRLMAPPNPYCRTDEEVDANLAFMARNVSRILQGKAAAKTAKPLLPETLPGDEERARELHRIRLYSTVQLQARMVSLEAVLQQGETRTGESVVLENKLGVLRSEFQNRLRG